MIRALVNDNFEYLGVNIALVIAEGEQAPVTHVLHADNDGHVHWDMREPNVRTAPTMVLGHEEARALLDGLLRHYQGASDMHTARDDLLHERARVDGLIDTVSRIATGRAT